MEERVGLLGLFSQGERLKSRLEFSVVVFGLVLPTPQGGLREGLE